MVPSQASPLQDQILCSLADASPPLHWTRGAFCPHRCPSQLLGIAVHFASALSSSHVTQTSSVASEESTITLLIGGHEGSITVVTGQKEPAEQQSNSS